MHHKIEHMITNLEFDADDSSVTRPFERVKELISHSGLEIIEKETQKDFPNGLYPVYALALRPKS